MHWLFKSCNLAGLTLSNRIVMAPMTRARAKSHVPDAHTVLYYEQRAGAGLIITEGSQISTEGQGYLFSPGIHSRQQIDGWRNVTTAVHAQGGKIFIQLWHVGRISHVSLQENAQAPVSAVARPAMNETAYAYDASGNPGRVPVSPARPLRTDEIPRLIGDFVNAAQNAIEAGFDGVELHGANGYLFEQFINADFNTRTDQYGGGTVQNRLRFTLETIDAVIARIGSHRTGIRLAPFGRLHDMHPFEEEEGTWLALAHELNSRQLSYVHLSDQETLGAVPIQKQFLRQFRDAYNGTLILAGGFTRETAQQAIDEGLGDLIAFGRYFIPNPDLVQRLENEWPLVEPDRETFYGGDARGYTDYPPYVPA